MRYRRVGGLEVFAVGAIMALGLLAYRHFMLYQPMGDTAIRARVGPSLTSAVARRGFELPAFYPVRASPAIALAGAKALFSSVPVALTSNTSGTSAATASRQTVAPPPMPYVHVGFIEAGGARRAVLARGGFLLPGTLGERVDDNFSVAAVDPPALLHLPTGNIYNVPRQSAIDATLPPEPQLALLLSSRAMVGSAAQGAVPAETIDTAAIEAEIATALATPAPEPLAPSSFPLAR